MYTLQDLVESHAKVIDSLKLVLYNRHPDIFQRLDFEDDTIYAEPLLYTYINQPDTKWLDAIIYGYEKIKKPVIEVFSNAQGVIYIPGIGYFLTDLPYTTFLLKTSESGFSLEFNGEKIGYVFEELLFFDYGIEIVKYQYPLFEAIFDEEDTEDSPILIKDVYKHHLTTMSKGLELIKQYNPEFFRMLLICLKKIMLFTARLPYSFATLSIHNMIFMNVNLWDTEIFFVDHFSHEGAHVIFFTITYDSKVRMFTCPFNTPATDIKSLGLNHGTIYLRFHGLFTFQEIARSLALCMASLPSSDKNQDEIRGRLIFQMERFRLMLDLFSDKEILAAEGLQWFESFKETYKNLTAQYNAVAGMYDLSDQPYDFSYKIFTEKNKQQISI